MKKIMTLIVISLLLHTSFSCTNDEGRNSNQLKLIGTWELVKIEDSQNGINLPSNDSKPVQIIFKNDGVYEGTAGNNQIHGEYKVNNGMIIMTLHSTEISRTEWELMFMNAINQTSSKNEFRIPFTVETTELVFQYQEQSNMRFKKI